MPGGESATKRSVSYQSMMTEDRARGSMALALLALLYIVVLSTCFDNTFWQWCRWRHLDSESVYDGFYQR